MSDYEKRKRIEEAIEKRGRLEGLKKKYNKKLADERKLSAFKKAARCFSFPFKEEAFSALWTAARTVMITIIFASCAGFIAVAAMVCGIIDLLYILLFAVAYPFLVLYFLLFKGLRIKCFERKIEKINQQLKSCRSMKTLSKELAECNPKSTHSYTSSDSSGITSTDYYKEKVDEYYRIYMGYPPKEDKALSDLATDTTLDLHPGDY